MITVVESSRPGVGKSELKTKKSITTKRCQLIEINVHHWQLIAINRMLHS